MRWILALALTLTACGGVDELGTDTGLLREGERQRCVADCGREGPTVTCFLSTAPQCPAAAEIPDWCDRARVIWTLPRDFGPCDVGD